jgi:LacI family transcriptional regulator
VPAVAVPDDQSPRRAARELAGDLLERGDRPSGVVAMSDELAAGVVDAAVVRGIEVPGQLSVVGFDDTPTATSVSPPLTTIHQPLAARGEAAARLLLEGAPARVVEFPTELVVRCSTTRAPT